MIQDDSALPVSVINIQPKRTDGLYSLDYQLQLSNRKPLQQTASNLATTRVAAVELDLQIVAGYLPVLTAFEDIWQMGYWQICVSEGGTPTSRPP